MNKEQYREYIKIYMREYYKTHKEEMIDRSNKYNKEHKDDRTEYMRKYRNKDVQKNKNYNNNYYARNKERINARRKELRDMRKDNKEE